MSDQVPISTVLVTAANLLDRLLNLAKSDEERAAYRKHYQSLEDSHESETWLSDQIFVLEREEFGFFNETDMAFEQEAPGDDVC